MDYLMVSRKEMKEILKGTGWKVKEFIDSDNSQYIAIIKKVTSPASQWLPTFWLLLLIQSKILP